jgi:hypothetical protein
VKKIELKFMVVPDAVRVKVVDPEAIFLLGILGESGRKLVEAGVEFYFEGQLAEKLISSVQRQIT